MPHVSKNANFSEKGIKNARLATLIVGVKWQLAGGRRDGRSKQTISLEKREEGIEKKRGDGCCWPKGKGCNACRQKCPKGFASKCKYKTFWDQKILTNALAQKFLSCSFSPGILKFLLSRTRGAFPAPPLYLPPPFPLPTHLFFVAVALARRTRRKKHFVSN